MWIINPIPTKELAAKTKASRKAVYLLGMGAGSVMGGELEEAEAEGAGVFETAGVAALALSGLGSRALSGRPTNMWTQAQNQHTPLQPNLLST
jgi:hypothetical protein